MRTDETLAWEARRRPRAALAAVLASLLILGSYTASGIAFAGAPRASLLPAIVAAGKPGPVGEATSLKVPFFEFYADRAAVLLGSSFGRAIGFLLVGAALTFLAFATRARSPQVSKLALYAPVVGGVLSAISSITSPVGTVLAVNDFLDGPRTVAAAADVDSSALIATSAVIGLVGALALGLAYMLVSLNGMRAGLLTRFMGVLGILAGALFIIPLGSPLPVVQCFWLAALAWLLLGRWPGGDPPAWRTGEAVPWPTQQELREARERGEPQPSPGRRGREPDPVAVVTAPAGERTASRPSSRKRKRKRRS